tara:strand:- start:25402 stop:26925 length:1524 start_codon:yes stop_codon:yes gene_type:complete
MDKKIESTTKKGISGMLWTFSGTIIQTIMQLLVIGVLARLLTPDEFGIVAVMMILVTFSELFSQMGIGSALIQLPTITSKHISQAYSLSLFIGLIIGLLFYLIAPWVGAFFELKNVDNAIKFFALFFPLRSFSSITTALLTRNLRFSVMVKCGVVSYIFGIGLTSIVLAYLNFSFWALILGQFASLLITMIFLMYYERPRFTLVFDKPILRELLFFGSGHTLGSIFNYFAENADNIVVGKLLGTTVLGVYSKAFQLLSIPAKFFGSIFDKVLFPILSKNQGKKEKLSDFYLFMNSICFGLLMPISIAVFINAKLIVDTLLGNQWQEVVFPLQILIIGLSYRFGTKINKSYLKSMGLIYRGAYYQFIFAALMFGCCIVGGYFFGLPGVAVGVLIATVLNYLQVSYRLYIELKFSKLTFLKLHLITLTTNIPFLVFTLFLYYFEVRSKWTHLILTLMLYAPIMIFIFVNKSNIIFNTQNFNILSQILRSLPNAIQKNFKKVRFFKQYYV